MTLKLTGELVPIYMRERFEALRSGDKYRFRSFLAKYFADKKQLPIDEVERAMHIIRANEMALPPAERERSKNWLKLYNKYLT